MSSGVLSILRRGSALQCVAWSSSHCPCVQIFCFETRTKTESLTGTHFRSALAASVFLARLRHLDQKPNDLLVAVGHKRILDFRPSPLATRSCADPTSGAFAQSGWSAMLCDEGGKVVQATFAVCRCRMWGPPSLHQFAVRALPLPSPGCRAAPSWATSSKDGSC